MIPKSEIRPIVKEIVKFRDGSLENSTQEPAKSWSTSKVPLGLSSPEGTSQIIVRITLFYYHTSLTYFFRFLVPP